MSIAGNAPCSVCFPTGDTPRRLYAELVGRCQSGAQSLANVHTFNLDEWGDLPVDDRNRCISELHRALYDDTDIPPAWETAELCRRYESEIEALGAFATVGVGLNGHVGFDEPGSRLSDPTRRVELAATTEIPASLLRDHPNLTILLDDEAASLLQA